MKSFKFWVLIYNISLKLLIMSEDNKELLEKAEEISNGLKRLSKKSRKVVMPYHRSYDFIEELEEVADSLVQDLKE